MELAILQFYAQSLGWPLFPCSNRNKKPVIQGGNGFKDATTDLKQLEAWRQQFPDCAWGTPTSAERGVIDIDPRNGGAESLARLIAQHGPLPLTPKVLTGGNGIHFYLSFPPGTASGKIADGIDRKAIGGYVIVPPSRIDISEHEGRAYAWEVRPWEVPIADVPAWCYGTRPTPTASASVDAGNPWIVRPAGDDLLTHPGCSHGQRRKTFCQLAGIHISRGDSESTLYAASEAWAGRCAPTFDGKPDPGPTLHRPPIFFPTC